MGYTAKVDRELCVGAGACIELIYEDGKEVDLFA